MSKKSLIRMNEFLQSGFTDLFHPWNDISAHGFANRYLVPAMNIAENKNDYMITLAVPGLKKNDFNILIDRNLSAIGAQKEETNDENSENYTRKEFYYSSFSRTFTLPEGVHANKVDTSYNDDMLTLTLPKKDEEKKINLKNH
jgi:HSP20 family protein